MKANQLKKDKRFSGRINSRIYEALKKKGITVQKIVDKFVEENLTVENEVKFIKKK